MKRSVKVSTPEVKIDVLINAQYLTRRETEELRDHIASKLMLMCSELPYYKDTPLSKVKVS